MSEVMNVGVMNVGQSDWGSPCNHHQAIEKVTFICQVCFDQNRCCYTTIVLHLQYILLSLFFSRDGRAKGGGESSISEGQLWR